MSSPTIWSAGRYDAVGDRIAPIAAEVVAAVDRRRPLSGAAVADLACGTGSAALAAAAAGARVTAVDITPELLAIGEQKADAAGRSITWVAGDASDTGLPGASFDAVVSNMGIIFVEPAGQVAEIARLLVPGGILGFSSWVRDPGNPFFSPIVAVLGPPPASAYSPDQWGAADMITDRLAADFDDVEIQSGTHTWQLGTVEEAVYFVTNESPMHVSMLGTVDGADRGRLLAAFEEAMRAHAGADGIVSYDSPYVGGDGLPAVTAYSSVACSGSGSAGSISSGPLLRTLLTSRDTSRISIRSRSPCPRSRPSSMGASGSSQRSQSVALIVSGMRSWISASGPAASVVMIVALSSGLLSLAALLGRHVVHSPAMNSGSPSAPYM